ncbi:MAG: hypothetical protein RIR66_727 [Actinomycetota bacterium]|jgi:hypothetical protein
MTQYQITYWQDLPSMVVAKLGEETVKVQLAQRLQEAIDEAAMRLGASDSDAYLAGWRRSDWLEADGEPTTVAEQISAELENEFTEDKIAEFLDQLNS